jgi:hypothetical protein
MTAKQRGQTLILLGIWLVLSGGATTVLVVYDRSSSDLAKSIKSTITDVHRKREILTELELWDSVQEKRDDQVGDDRKALLKALRRKDTQRADLAPIMARLDAQFSAMDRDFLDLRFQLKDRVTSAEWAQIVGRTVR